MPTRSHPESARIIREARQAAGLTQLELAEKLGVTIGTIGCYERGAGMPTTDNLFALCDILHIRPADLLRADSEITVSASFYIFHRLLPARVSICTQPVRRLGWAASFG